MEEDTRSVKELLMKILDKCRDALPQIAAITQQIDKITKEQGNSKLKKKDCMNPYFLVQLSECGQRIRIILQDALKYDSPFHDCLLHNYKDYMKVIKDIKGYHQQAHRAHDIHKNSTKVKENLIRELNQKSEIRIQLKQEIQIIKEEFARVLADRDARIRNLQEENTHITISQISQISKSKETQGPLYGGRDKVMIQGDSQDFSESKRLKSKLLEIQSQLADCEKKHQYQLGHQRKMFAEKQKKYNLQLEQLRNLLIQKETPQDYQSSGQIRKVLAEKDRAHAQELEKQRKLFAQKERVHGQELEQQRKLLAQKQKAKCNQIEQQHKQQLASKEKNHSRQLEQQRKQIIELQSKFEEFTQANLASQDTSKFLTFKNLNVVSIPPSSNQMLDENEFYRWMLVQASTIEEYLNEGKQ